MSRNSTRLWLVFTAHSTFLKSENSKFIKVIFVFFLIIITSSRECINKNTVVIYGVDFVGQ